MKLKLGRALNFPRTKCFTIAIPGFGHNIDEGLWFKLHHRLQMIGHFRSMP